MSQNVKTKNHRKKKTVRKAGLGLCSLWAPFPHYRNEWFQYLCNGVLRTNRISLTGKEAIKTFYFSEGSEVNLATEQNYFCLQKSWHIHTPTIDHNWDYHIKYLQIWFHYKVSRMKEQSKFCWIAEMQVWYQSRNLTGKKIRGDHMWTVSTKEYMLQSASPLMGFDTNSFSFSTRHC